MHLLTEEQRKVLEDIPIKKRQKEILKEEYRNGEWYANDIRRVYAGDIPKADCWCFGFPCLPKELIFLQKKDISQLKMYLSEIKSLRTKEDGEKLQQQCAGTEQDSGMSMDSEYCQQEPRQSIRIMSLSRISQWNSKSGTT